MDSGSGGDSGGLRLSRQGGRGRQGLAQSRKDRQGRQGRNQGWSLLIVLWLAIGAGALSFPPDRFSVPHLGLIVLFMGSFVAGFNRTTLARTVASVLILIGAGMFASMGEAPAVSMGIGLPGLGLFLLNSLKL